MVLDLWRRRTAGQKLNMDFIIAAFGHSKRGALLRLRQYMFEGQGRGKRMEAAVVTKQEIDEAREAYRTVATRGSIIYFVIADMAPTRRPVVWRRLRAIFMNRLRESRW